jgi:hypothetical protein
MSAATMSTHGVMEGAAPWCLEKSSNIMTRLTLHQDDAGVITQTRADGE